jgi:hypothetical protein
MFLYSPPRILFTAAEQALLRLSLRGSTDRAMSDDLGIPLTAVKARWNRIHARVMAQLPDLFAGVSLPDRGRTRGTQFRHLILDYVRDNPSELTPHPRPVRAHTASR